MALANIGMIQGFQKKFDAAEKTYLEYVERHPNDPEGPFGLSSVYLNNKRPGDALQQAQAAVSLYKAAKSPYWVHAEFNIGLAYATMGQHKAAVPHLITARDNGVALPPQLAAIVDTGGVPKPISSSNSCDPAVFQTVHGPSSHPDYDALVLQCIDWFSSQRWVSPAKNKPLSRHQISSMWLMKEMTNHPTVHIVINNHFWVPGQAEPELLVVFMLGWFKYAIENNIAENKPEANPELMAALNAAGVRFVLAYQQRHGYTQTMTFQTYAEAEKEGRLDTWFGDIAKKIAAKANP